MPDSCFYILTIGLPALVLFYSAGCLAALRPRTGTLDWIAACDRPVPLLLGHAHPAGKRDLICLAAVCLLACLTRGAGVMRLWAVRGSQPPAPALLVQVGAPLEAAALSYLLMKRLFGKTVPAALCAALITADFSADPVSLGFSAAALFFLVCYLTVPEQAGFRQTAIPLAGGFAALAAGCYFDPALLLLLPAALFLCVMGCVDRFIMTGKLWLPACLAAALLPAVLTWIAVFIPAGIDEGYAFPALLVEGDYYWMVLRRLGTGVAALFGQRRATAQHVQGFFLLLAALPALAAAVVWAVCGRDRRSLVILIWFAAQLITLNLLGSNALSLACAVCLCQVWSKLEENRFLWLAWVGGGALLALLLAAHFLFGS